MKKVINIEYKQRNEIYVQTITAGTPILIPWPHAAIPEHTNIFMESFDLDHHLRSAISLIRSTPLVIGWLFFIAVWNTSSTLIEGQEIGPLGISAFILSLFTTPVIYGILYDRLTGTSSPPGSIIETYIPGYFWLLIRMYLPALFVAAMPMMLAPQSAGEGHFFVILISFSIIYLFVIPSYFVTGQQRGAIFSGLSFLAENFFRCTPILLTVVLLETSMLVVEHNELNLFELGPVLYGFIDISVYFVASIVDYIIFIMLILIIRNPVD